MGCLVRTPAANFTRAICTFECSIICGCSASFTDEPLEGIIVTVTALVFQKFFQNYTYIFFPASPGLVNASPFKSYKFVGLLRVKTNGTNLSHPV